MRKLLLVMCCLLISLLHAEGLRFKPIGPAAGEVEQIVPDRSRPNLWFAIVNGTLYRSADRGIHWRRTSLTNVLQVLIHPATSEVFAIAAQGAHNWRFQIFVSSDHGQTFRPRSSQIYGHIVVHPLDPKIIYNTYGPAVSLDGGNHWRNFANFPRIPIDCDYDCYYHFRDLVVSPFDTKTIYMTGSINWGSDPPFPYSPVLLVSINGGQTWELAEHASYTFHTDALFPKRVFAFNKSGIKVLSATGWKVLASLGVARLITVPRRPEEMYALRNRTWDSYEMLHSTDGGRTWNEFSDSMKNLVIHLAALDDSSGSLLGGTSGAGIFRLDTQTQSGWVPSGSGLEEGVFRNIGASSPIVYGIASRGGESKFLYHTGDSGKEWRIRITPKIESIAVKPDDPTYLLATTPSGSSIILSKDGGKTWRRTSGPNLDSYGLSNITFDPSDTEVVYVTYSFGAVYKSTNAGMNWKRLPLLFKELLYINRLIIDEKQTNILYIPTSDGIYKSMDGGKTMHRVDRGLPCSPECDAIDMAPLAQKDSYMLMLRDGQLFRTDNGGQDWNRITKIPGRYPNRLFAADRIGNHFLAIANPTWGKSNQLFESTDGGRSWKNITEELGQGIEVYDLTDPRIFPFYIGTNHGIFMSR